jgi:hypothetical protein
MVIDSIMIGLTGIGFLLVPLVASERLGLPPATDQEWAIRLIGLLLIALAAHVFTTSRTAGDRAFRSMALLMAVVSGSVSSTLYAAPGEITNGRLISVGLAGLWAALYLITLPIKTIGLNENQN